jgi:hypothetical protein
MFRALFFGARLAAAQRLVVSIQTYSPNHYMVDLSRNSWRAGVSTVVITNGTTERRVSSPFPDEAWWEAPDAPSIGWNNPSENRYTSQVRFANQSFDFDWLLGGDDDTIFLVDNVRNLVRGLDSEELFYISDSLPDDGFACTLPLEASERGPGDCIKTPPAAPCLRSVMEAHDVCLADRVQPRALRGYYGGGKGEVERPGGTVWGFGQYGFLASRGLIRSVSEPDFAACEWCNSSRFTCYGGGDVRIGECFWSFGANGRGVAPTVPYSHAGVRVFGHDFNNILRHALTVVEGRHCDGTCRFVLDRVLTTDIHHASPCDYARDTSVFTQTYAHAKKLLHGEARSIVIP